MDRAGCTNSLRFFRYIHGAGRLITGHEDEMAFGMNWIGFSAIPFRGLQSIREINPGSRRYLFFVLHFF